jgi:hypothetical protein
VEYPYAIRRVVGIDRRRWPSHGDALAAVGLDVYCVNQFRQALLRAGLLAGWPLASEPGTHSKR